MKYLTFVLVGLASFSGLAQGDTLEERLAFNRDYPESDKNRIFSWVDTKASLSGVVLHRGLVFAPLGAGTGLVSGQLFPLTGDFKPFYGWLKGSDGLVHQCGPIRLQAGIF